MPPLDYKIWWKGYFEILEHLYRVFAQLDKTKNQLTYRKRLRRKLRNKSVESLRFVIIHAILTQTTVKTLSTLRKRHATIFFIALFHACQIWPEKLILQNLWCHSKFQISVWLAERLGVPCGSMGIYELSFRPTIKILSLSVMRVWIGKTQEIDHSTRARDRVIRDQDQFVQRQIRLTKFKRPSWSNF